MLVAASLERCMHRCGSFMDRTYCSNFVSDGLENKVTRAPGFDLDVRQELLMCARGCRPCGRCQSKDISTSGSRDLASHDYMRDKAEVLHTQSLHVGLFLQCSCMCCWHSTFAAENTTCLLQCHGIYVIRAPL